MAEQTQPQIKPLEVLSQEEIGKIIEIVREKLNFAINPEQPKTLGLLPPFSTIPVYQKLRDAPYKLKTEFKKYYDMDHRILAFVNNDAAIRMFANGDIDMVFQARTSKKLYYYKFTKHEIYELFPADLETYTINDTESAVLATVDDIVKQFFALDIKFTGKGYKQGHLYILELEQQRNMAHWVVDEVNEVFAHKIYYYNPDLYFNRYEPKDVYKLTNEIYYAEIDRETRIVHEEHGEIELPTGKYLLYHPEWVD